jgi:glucosamine 6-phosphate synthetase-like amidotransferase/phosphosugar isomerase protein
MGASYHAAWAMNCYAHSLSIPALAGEAADTLNYGSALLNANRPLVFTSQSGKSAEVAPILDRLHALRAEFCSVANGADSSMYRALHKTLHFAISYKFSRIACAMAGRAVMSVMH